MPDDLSYQLTDELVRAAFGSQSFLRGAAYARGGQVGDVTIDRRKGTFFAVVQGNARYHTLVTIDPQRPADPTSITGGCTCPVGDDCKHAAAVIIAARDQLNGDAPPSWERTLGSVVEAQVRTTTRSAAAEPLALQVELVQRRKGYGAGPAMPARIRLHPVQRGRSGAWVRTGVSWRELRYPFGTPRLPAQRELLRTLFGLQQAANPVGWGSDDKVYLDDLGPSGWDLLEQAASVGIELTPARKKAGPVVLAGVATVGLDLVKGEREAVLTPVVTLDDRSVPATAVTLVGTPVHGVVLTDEAAEPFGDPSPSLVLAPMDHTLAPHLEKLLRDGPVPIPSADLNRFLNDFYPGLRQAVAVVSSDESVDLPELPRPQLALTVAYEAGHRVTLTWAYVYEGASSYHRHPIDEPAVGLGLRDPAAEQDLLETLAIPLGWTDTLRGGSVRPIAAETVLAGIDAALFTEDLLPVLQDLDGLIVEVVGTPPDYRRSEEGPVVRVSATGGDGDWFDLGVTVTVDGEDVGFEDLFVALARGDKQMMLLSGTYFDLDLPELDRLRRLIEEARALQERDSESLRISTYQVGLWDELRELGVVDEQSERWERTVTGLLDLDEVPAVKLPVGFRAELRPYQRDGYHWLSFLYDHGLGGILADDMGLGKTVQTLAMMCRVFEADPGSAPFLVVAPTSVVQNWAKEAQRFAPDLLTATVAGTERRRGEPLDRAVGGAHVVVTSYALFRLEIEAYSALPWSGLVLDEAQFVKNHQAKTYQCARRLPAPFKLAITGTPLENSLMDLWALLSIVAPGLFPDPGRFAEYYRKPIERGEFPERLTALQRRIRPLMRRRTKEQVAADLPPKVEQVLEVVLNPRHQKIYQTHLQRERQKILGLIDDLDKHRFTIFRSLTLLRQLSLAPSLVDPKYASVPSSKLDAFLEQLEEVVQEGHRSLVFSQFTGFLALVRERLDADGIAYAYLDGSTRDRGAVIDGFKNGDAPVFLISLKAGGFGLNLTEADYCFVLDPWWNPAAESQAVDRTHRIGQDKTVMVYRLVAADTIEEKVMELKARKQALFAQIMDDDAALSSPLGKDDILGLLGRD